MPPRCNEAITADAVTHDGPAHAPSREVLCGEGPRLGPLDPRAAAGHLATRRRRGRGPGARFRGIERRPGRAGRTCLGRAAGRCGRASWGFVLTERSGRRKLGREEEGEPTVRVATYTRISTDEAHQPYSLDAQDQRLGSYMASQEGWQHVASFTDQTLRGDVGAPRHPSRPGPSPGRSLRRPPRLPHRPALSQRAGPGPGHRGLSMAPAWPSGRPPSPSTLKPRRDA